MATISAVRMTAEQAQAALAETEAALAKHAETCATCKASPDGGGFRIWRVCPVGASFVRTHLALSHRIHYLAARQRRQAKNEQE
jgi:hypothetical protein